MQPIWRPTPGRIAQSEMMAFVAETNRRWGRNISDYQGLHQFSVGEPELLWSAVWDFCGVIAEKRGDGVLTDGDRVPGATWFAQARLNFESNLLRGSDEEVAIVAVREDGERRTHTIAEMYGLVSRIAQAMTANGVVAGDRVAVSMPDVPGAV